MQIHRFETCYPRCLTRASFLKLALLSSVSILSACGENSLPLAIKPDAQVDEHRPRDKDRPLTNDDSDLGYEAVRLSIVVNKLKNKNGQICYSVFDRAEPFPNDVNQAIIFGCEKIAGEQHKITVKNLAKNTDYAIAIFHDENSNSRLDTRKIINMDAPKEGFGFSRNPGLTGFGPPSFDKVKVSFPEQNAALNIDLLYLF